MPSFMVSAVALLLAGLSASPILAGGVASAAAQRGAVTLEQVIRACGAERMDARDEVGWAGSAEKFLAQMYPQGAGRSLHLIGAWHHRGMRLSSGRRKGAHLLVYRSTAPAPKPGYAVAFEPDARTIKSRWLFLAVERADAIPLRLLAQFCHHVGYTFSEDDDVAASAQSFTRLGNPDREVRYSPGVARLRQAREEAAWTQGRGIFARLAGEKASREVYDPLMAEDMAERRAEVDQAAASGFAHEAEVDLIRLPPEGVTFAGRRYADSAGGDMERLIAALKLERMTPEDEDAFATPAAEHRDQMYPQAAGRTLRLIGGWHHGVRYLTTVTEKPFVVLIYRSDPPAPPANYTVTFEDEKGTVRSRWLFLTVDREDHDMTPRAIAEFCHALGYTFEEDDDRAAWVLANARVGEANRPVQFSPGMERLRMAREKTAWEHGRWAFKNLVGSTTAYGEVFESLMTRHLGDVQAALDHAMARAARGRRGEPVVRLPDKGVEFSGYLYTESGAFPLKGLGPAGK